MAGRKHIARTERTQARSGIARSAPQAPRVSTTFGVVFRLHLMTMDRQDKIEVQDWTEAPANLADMFAEARKRECWEYKRSSPHLGQPQYLQDSLEWYATGISRGPGREIDRQVQPATGTRVWHCFTRDGKHAASIRIDAADGDIPVSCLLTAASVHDSQVAIPLAQQTDGRVTYPL